MAHMSSPARQSILLLALVLLATLLSTGAAQTGVSPRKIEITAKRFSYEPAEITLKKGEPVTLIFRSLDVTHGFSVKEFHLKAVIHKNRPTELTFVPDEAGTFEAHCSYFCGIGHGSMKMIIHVTE